jgi:hypothetical protein
LRCMTFRHQFRVAVGGSTARLRHPLTVCLVLADSPSHR